MGTGRAALMGGMHAGTVGALLGLALGVLQYWIAGTRAEKKVRGAPNDLAPDQRVIFDRQVAFVRRILFWSTVMIYPVLGYAIGRTLGTK